MADSMRTVRCETHGLQPQTRVCQHIVDGLIRRERVGFFWTQDDHDNPRPDAVCAACDARVAETGGEWIGAALEHAQPKTLCGACYDIAKVFHSGGDPWS